MDLIWSYAGTTVFAIAGLSITGGVAVFYGAEGLGVFNQVYAVYLIVGHFANGGSYESALRHVAESDAPEPEKDAIALAAALAGLTVAIPIAILLWIAAPLIAGFLDSDGVSIGLRSAAPALPLLAINSALLGGLNGSRKIRALAISVSLRFVAIAAGLLPWVGPARLRLNCPPPFFGQSY